MKQLPHHFLQTDAWGAFQTALGRKVIEASGENWHWLAIIERGKLGTRLYCPYGPTATSKTALEEALSGLKATARKHGAIFVRIEPIAPVAGEELRALGAIPAARDMQPKHTWRVNLKQSEEKIITGMRATNRNLHRTASKKGLSFRQSDNPKDIHLFLPFVHETARRTGIRPHSDPYFKLQAETLIPGGKAHLFFAEFEGKPIAAAFVYDSADTRVYAHAGSSFAHRKLHPGEPLVSHMILDTKKAGFSYFDFNGIAPPSQPNHPWAGFTSFKKSFGGEQYDFAGTWEIPLKKVPYRLYRTALSVVSQSGKLRNKARKIARG